MPSGQSSNSRLPLHGKVVVLDPGHNGGNFTHAQVIARQVPAGGFTKHCDETGASTDSGYTEAEFTWQVASVAAAVLRHDGATVVLTRSSNMTVGPCVNVRAAVGNDADAAAVVSIHADGGPSGARGFHVIEPAIAPASRQPAKLLRDSARLAAILRSSFRTDTGEPLATYERAQIEPGLTRRADLAGLNLSTVPKVFIECANMRNGRDAFLVAAPEWRARAGTAIARGIEAFINSSER
jgi:N-acetylmuramoyl-L-alanine amidase